MKHSAFAQDGAGPWSADLPVVPRSYGSSGELDVIALVRVMEAVILPPDMLVLWDRRHRRRSDMPADPDEALASEV